jgi:hypothetical chaperone protein
MSVEGFIGLDFGTTNSALALASPTGDVSLLPLRARRGTQETFRSVLHFDPDERGPDRRPLCTAGADAIDAYIEAGAGRFVQSIKSHLASASFTHTAVFGVRYSLEDLVVRLIDAVFSASDAAVPERLVCGRPVHFVNDDADGASDARAEARLKDALGRVGVKEVVFELEPVAAAWRYEERLDDDELLLIADFGGGTTDLCLVEVGPSHRGRGRERVLVTDGVGIAGDAFDQRVLERAVAPHLGMGSRYEVIGGDADVPLWLYQHLSRWHLLSFLKSQKTLAQLRTIERTAYQRDAIERFLRVIEEDLGYPLHRAVERAKVALSSEEEVDFHFDLVDLQRTLGRGEFQEWIAPDLEAMANALDRLLERVGARPSEVSRVFMTGGTSLVPSVRELFASRFSEERLVGGEELTTVAHGLALAARHAFGG